VLIQSISIATRHAQY